MNILIADSLFTACRITTNLLQDSGFTNISAANDGETALSMLQEGYFYFLLTDVDLPSKFGIELLKAVRGDEKLSKLPVLITQVVRCTSILSKPHRRVLMVILLSHSQPKR